MLELQTKIKRQIEILGMAIDNTEHLKDADFAVLFNRDIPTIKRDMQELRASGIDVHSEKKRGVCLTGAIDPPMVAELIIQYMGISGARSGADKATSLLVKALREKALSTLVALQRCIEEHVIAVIDYQKDAGEVEAGKEISPLLIFSSQGYWRVLAMNQGRMKQYHLNKLLSIRRGKEHFKPPPQQEIDDLFRHSFRSWIGTERHNIKLALDSIWAERLKPQQLMETQLISEEPDGSVILEATVNSLDEVASWVVSRGKGVAVLAPDNLRQKVIDLAKGALANYT
jgi:predicted DNA-binding transcriptional regulator YafY